MAPAMVQDDTPTAFPSLLSIRQDANPLTSDPFADVDSLTQSISPSSSPPSDLRAREPASEDAWSLQVSNSLESRDSPQPVNPNFNPMQGARPPESFHNKGFFALFALLGAAMVIAAIWFFFWAENGGFRWQRGDWDDYKSTVLRRKDKYGNTLSNATPRTNLGQKSVAGTFDYEKRDPEMGEINDGSPRRHRRHKHSRPHGERGNSDDDVRAYRQEKSAKVGGLNRQHDGSHYDFTNSEYSYSVYTPSNADETISNDSRTHLRSHPSPSQPESPKKPSFLAKKKEQLTQKKEEKKVAKDQKKVEKAARKDEKKGKKVEPSTPQRASGPTRVRPAQRRPSLSTIDAASTIADSADQGQLRQDNSYYANYRPEQPAFARSYGNHGSPPRRSSPRHSPRHSPRPSEPRQSSPLKREFMPRPPGSFDAYSDAGSQDSGTKVHQHHIPGVARSGGTPSRSHGYRRGGGGRRDSLSDSD